PERLAELDGGLQAAVAGAFRRLEAANAAVAADGEEVRGQQRIAGILAGQQALDRPVGPRVLPGEHRAAGDGRGRVAAGDAGERAPRHWQPWTSCRLVNNVVSARRNR